MSEEITYTIFHDDGPITLTEHELANGYMRFREALREIRQAQPRRLRFFETSGVVFHNAPLTRPPESEAEKWEQIAFSIYTDLCEIESLCGAVLAAE